MTEYIPLTLEQKYFKQPIFPGVIEKEIGEVIASASAAAVQVQTPAPILNLDQRQFSETKDNINGNMIMLGLLIVGGVVAVVYCGKFLCKKKNQSDQQQAQLLKQQIEKEIIAARNKAKNSGNPNDPTSDSTSPQLPGNSPPPPPGSPQSPAPIHQGLANYPGQPATYHSTM